LEIELELLESPVSLGIEDRIINFSSMEQLYDYEQLLEYLYPESKKDIDEIIGVIKRNFEGYEILYELIIHLFSI